MNFFESQEFTAFLRLRIAEKCNVAIPTCCYKPKASLIIEENNIRYLISYIKCFILASVKYYCAAEDVVNLDNTPLESNKKILKCWVDCNKLYFTFMSKGCLIVSTDTIIIFILYNL